MDCRTLLANSIGQTLYGFDPDLGADQPKCNGTCAEVWPPFLINSEEASHLASPLSSVVRESGRIQLTYQGRPVYLFSLDRASGEKKGDGLGGVWHVIDAQELKAVESLQASPSELR